jgi:hypothetical protein
MGKSGCIDNDLGLKKIFEEMNALSGLAVKAGILENAGEVDGIPIAQYGAYNEYGVPGKDKIWDIPPRPFIRGYVDANREKINTYTEWLVRQVSEGKITAVEAAEKLGENTRDGIKHFIKDGDFEPNAESTVERKKTNRPLTDTGRMRDSVDYEVVKK